jgi:tetratricopeptide (TPR) repeat protein
MTLAVFAGCASTHPLPSWVSSLKTHEGYYRAVGFGQGKKIPEAVHEARMNALRQIVESSFGESVRFEYKKKSERSPDIQSASVVDFFQSESSGSLLGQRVVHNEVNPAGTGFVAYVLVEVSKKDLKVAYDKYLEDQKAKRDLLVAETRGATLLETHHYRKALAYYQDMVRKNPGSDVWWIGVGASLYRLGQYRKALEATDTGLLRNPRSFFGYWNRSSILSELGKNREALESLGQACRIRPSRACSRRMEQERRKLR